jgi:hypothetical protein
MDQTPDESNESFEQLTKIVARAGGISDVEAERIASSPFLHARLRAGIDAERQRRAEQGSGWLGTLLVASRAIAVLVVVTIAAVMTFWFSKANASVIVPPLNANADDISRVVIGGTCALSTTEECAISTEEVLATLFAEQGGEERK